MAPRSGRNGARASVLVAAGRGQWLALRNAVIGTQRLASAPPNRRPRAAIGLLRKDRVQHRGEDRPDPKAMSRGTGPARGASPAAVSP